MEGISENTQSVATESKKKSTFKIDITRELDSKIVSHRIASIVMVYTKRRTLHFEARRGGKETWNFDDSAVVCVCVCVLVCVSPLYIP